MNDDVPLYALSEEHRAIREAVRAVCDAKVAPFAAEVDEEARYPREAAEALQAADFHAPHVPEEYGGAGADALATCLVIEEVSRACVSASLIPAVNKLGSLPVQLAGSEELKQTYLTKLAAGEGGFSYCLSEPDAGSDAGAMRCRAVLDRGSDGDHYVLDGVKRWITNAGESEFYTVMAVTDPEKRTRGGITAFVVEKSDAGVSFGAPEKKLGIKGSPTREVFLDHVRIPADRMIGSEGEGFSIAMRTLDHTRVDDRRPGRRGRAGRPRLRARLRAGAPAVREVDRGVPGAPVPARRHGDEGGGRPTADVRRRRPLRARATPTSRSSAPPPSASPQTPPCRSPPTPCRSWAATATPATTRSSG